MTTTKNATTKMQIDLTPAPEARQALTLREQAGTLQVIDRDTHVHAMEFVRGAKQLHRTIKDHWSKIKRGIDELKRNMLTLEAEDLAPVEAAIAVASGQVLSYENRERERERIEAERRQREEQERAERQRQRELDRLEQARLKAEASSPDLSERETRFVALFCGESAAAGVKGDARQSAARAGYADPIKQGERLLNTKKIQAAISAKLRADELRQQQTALASAPLEVKEAPAVETRRGKVGGVSSATYYSAEVIDMKRFAQAVCDGTISFEHVLPNGPSLNDQARQLKETFEQAFPGCRLITRQGLRG